MAVTTLKAIIDRFQAVIAAAPLGLTATTQPFTFDRQPNTVIDDRYWVEDAGLTESTPLSSNQDARIDTLTVWMAKKRIFAGQATQETLETTLNTLERYILDDGPANGYHATLTEREVQPLDDTELLLAAATFTVDYDYTLSTT